MDERDVPLPNPILATLAPLGSSQAAGKSDSRVDHEREQRAEEICSRLLIERWLAKRSYRDLLVDDEMRAAVARRLGLVGLELVESFTSDWFAVRLKRSIEGDIAFDWATNTRLPRGAIALLVVVWAKLILPRRLEPADAVAVAADATEPTAKAAPAALASISREQLYAEFGRKFGKTAFARYLGQLKSAGFVREDRAGNLRDGPLLDLLVDGVEMAQKLRDSVLWDVLDRGVTDVIEGTDDPNDAESDDFGDDN
ncbi:MAG: hypothetical protein EXR77_02035 [Myxococcales bacterium]|nr:hypothetical protein [Myxococcales bacterium]